MFTAGNQLGLKHGHNTRAGGKSPTYTSWDSMKDRCNNPNHRNYHLYGGRGITVCLDWAWFPNFLKDMGERPEGTSIDRLNNDGNYCKDNCKWSTQAEQIHNSSTSKLGWKEVRAIRELQKRKCPVTAKRLAEWFGVTNWTIYDIRKGNTWPASA